MPSTSGLGSSFGKPIIGKEGKPTRIGLNVDGFDMIDTIQTIKEATLAGVKKETDTIANNKSVVIPAISTLQAQVQTFHDDAIALGNYLGTDPSIANTFQVVLPTISTTGTVNSTACVGVTVDSTVAKATNTPLAIRITQLASYDSRISTATIAPVVTDAATTELGLAGTFTINGGSTVTIATTDTLNTVIATINSSNSSVNARYIYNQADASFKLILEGTTLATSLTFTDTNGLLATNFNIDVTSLTDNNSLKAIVEYDVKNVIGGNTVIATQTYLYDTNVATDLSPGVTINLLNTTTNSVGGSDTLNINFSNNITAVYNQIVSFFSNYNKLKEVLNRNTLPDVDGAPLDPTATMFNSPLIRALNQQIDAIANIALVGAGAGDYSAWTDIGILIDQNATGFEINTYVLDSPTLLSALTTNFETVKKLFGNYTIVSNSNFRVFDLGNNLSSTVAGQPITITYSNTGGVFSARFVCGTEDTGVIAQTGTGILMGPVGSVFEGISIAYGGVAIADGSSKVFTLTATQGTAVQTTTNLDQTLDNTSGYFVGELQRIQDKNAIYQEKITRVKERAERIEKKMLVQSSRLDAERTKYAKFTQMLDNMFESNR